MDGLAGIPIDRSRLMLAVIILAAFAFRSYQLPSTPSGLFFDEALEGNQALESIRNRQFRVFYPENFGREGLFVWLAGAPLLVFGNAPWALRSVSVVAGAAVTSSRRNR